LAAVGERKPPMGAMVKSWKRTSSQIGLKQMLARIAANRRRFFDTTGAIAMVGFANQFPLSLSCGEFV
jgi:hypothetical protein